MTLASSERSEPATGVVSLYLSLVIWKVSVTRRRKTKHNRASMMDQPVTQNDARDNDQGQLTTTERHTIEYQVHRLSIAIRAHDNTIKPLVIDGAHSP